MYTMREHTKTLADLEATLGKLKEIGFSALQYSVPDRYDAKTVAKMFEDLNIVNDSVFCPGMLLEERVNQVIEQCNLFNTDHVRIDSIPRGLTSSPAGYKMYAHFLNEVCSEYKKHGIKVMYHFHSFEFIRFGDTTGIEIILKESDPEVVQLNPDTHWIHSGGKSIVDFLEKYKNRYDYMHAKDFAIGDMGSAWEVRPIEFAPVGEGNLNWKPILDTCKKNNVKFYAIEQDNCYGRNEFDCVKSSFDFLKKMGVED